MSKLQVCIIVPCFNEEKRLPVPQFEQFCLENQDYNLLFVDDGSSDGTLEVLQNLKKRYVDQIGVLRLEQNQGKAAAVRAGALHCFQQGTSDLVGYWDADLATPLDEVSRFVKQFRCSDCQMVIGARVQLLGRKISRNAIRHYLGRVFATLASILLEMPVYDTQCGAKIFRVSPLTKACFLRPFNSRWVFDVELLLRFRFELTSVANDDDAIEDSVIELPLNRWQEIAGSKLKWTSMLVVAWDFLKLVAQKRRLKSNRSMQSKNNFVDPAIQNRCNPLNSPYPVLTQSTFRRAG